MIRACTILLTSLLMAGCVGTNKGNPMKRVVTTSPICTSCQADRAGVDKIAPPSISAPLPLAVLYNRSKAATDALSAAIKAAPRGELEAFIRYVNKGKAEAAKAKLEKEREELRKKLVTPPEPRMRPEWEDPFKDFDPDKTY